MNRIVRTAAALIALTLLPSAASAELRRVQLNVLGMDWAYCAHAVSVAMRKLDGVETVEVSLEKASADIKLKADNKVTLPQIRRSIRSNGYPTKDAQITARGRIVERDGKPVLDLLNGSFLDLAEKPKDAPSDIVEVTGVSRADDKNIELLTIGSIKK